MLRAPFDELRVELLSKRADGGRRRAEGGRRRADARRQRADDGGQTTEGRGRVRGGTALRYSERRFAVL